MKQFFRNFKKQRTVGLLNISSLSLGVMVAIVIGLWTINELNFDRFHKNKDRIYRILTSATLNNAPVTLSTTYRPFGEQAKAELPAIEDMCRIFTYNTDITIDEVIHPDVKTFLTDANFFSFFTFPLLKGDLEQVLNTPDRVVISESAAKRYFPGKDPLGQMIKYQDRDFAVSGIMKDMPNNSSLQTDFVFPFFGFWAEAGWGRDDGYATYLLLQKGVDTETLAESLTQLEHREFEITKRIGASVSLESLTEMHFSSQMIYDPIIKGSKTLIMIFVLTALVILTISCINFTNLFISTSFVRAKAIGIRKAVGARQSALMRDFYIETVYYVLISIVIGLALSFTIIPAFNDFTKANLALDFTSPQLYVFLGCLLLCVVLMAGSFPALYMTRFNVLDILKGVFKGKKMSFFQKSLVIVQFTASIVLLIVVAFMQKQVDYIVSYDLGFNKEHVIYVQDRGRFDYDYKALEGLFLKEPSIQSVTRKNHLPTEWSQGWPVRKATDDNTMSVVMEACHVSPNYFDFFGMQIVDGENPFFLESTGSEVVINESAARQLGFEHPVGETILSNEDQRFVIRGVVKNAYTKSLHQEVDPQVYFKMGNDEPYMLNSVFFRVSGDPRRAISFIEGQWKEREAKYPFFYGFLDEHYQQLYTSELNAGRVFSFAMLITLIITMAGLFAMAYYATQRRVREIAIRKVYGASIKDIFLLLNRGFVWWVVISFAIACPVAYVGLQRWLEGFIIKTPLSIWVFVMIGFIALIITLLTTSYQTWKVARGNPVEGIKVE
ncbi:MAG: ABC transporter permease [Tannerella sp.]|jgi:putative ABC transport system permease protein|nr:ABC transporter permease [Tannerella sp.]